jgi:hypothetical protein
MFGSVYSISESAYNLVQFGAVASASVDNNYLGILLHRPVLGSNSYHVLCTQVRPASTIAGYERDFESPCLGELLHWMNQIDATPINPTIDNQCVEWDSYLVW